MTLKNKKLQVGAGAFIVVLVVLFVYSQTVVDQSTPANLENASQKQVQNTEIPQPATNATAQLEITPETILAIVNADGSSMELYDYSVAPNGTHVLTTVRTPRGFVVYKLINLKTKKDVFDSYTVSGDGNLNTDNHRWTKNNTLTIVSAFNSEGGEGFPGILVTDLSNETSYRLVDMSETCPVGVSAINCKDGYTFGLVDVTDRLVKYAVTFDAFAVGNDSELSYSEEKEIPFR